MGDCGSMGSGWWITQTYSDGPEPEIAELLAAVDIYIRSPKVPEPIHIDSEEHEDS